MVCCSGFVLLFLFVPFHYSVCSKQKWLVVLVQFFLFCRCLIPVLAGNKILFGSKLVHNHVKRVGKILGGGIRD